MGIVWNYNRNINVAYGFDFWMLAFSPEATASSAN